MFILKQSDVCFALLLSLSILPLKPVHADYAAKAEQQTDFIQANFYNPDRKLYDKTYPSQNKRPADTWDNGAELEALAAATAHDSAKYSSILHDFTIGMNAYWDPTPPFGDYDAVPYNGGTTTERYYDDNEWLVLGFADAYKATRNVEYLNLAKKTEDFVLSGWDDKLGGGIYWRIDHKSKNTCSNAPAAAAALSIAEINHDKSLVDWAVKIRDWTTTTLQTPDGLFWDNIALDGTITKWVFSYNSALMILTNTLLYKESKNPADLAAARRIADASITYWQNPATGSLDGREKSPIFTHLLCNAFINLYEVTHDVKYLNTVRAEATFAYRYVRLTSGGYSDTWTPATHNPADRQTLLNAAAAARLFWILAPYPDVDALYADGIAKATDGKYAAAEDLFRQAAASDPQDVKSRFRLWHVLQHEKKTDESATVSAQLTTMAQDPTAAQQLTALGWQAPPATTVAPTPPAAP
jgi:uncharacterized protein YyaL (SSP411 family)